MRGIFRHRLYIYLIIVYLDPCSPFTVYIFMCKLLLAGKVIECEIITLTRLFSYYSAIQCCIYNY